MAWLDRHRHALDTIRASSTNEIQVINQHNIGKQIEAIEWLNDGRQVRPSIWRIGFVLTAAFSMASK